MGLGQIKVLEENIHKRRKNHEFYKEIFDEITDTELFEVLNEDYFSSYWLSTILFSSHSKKKNEDLRIALEKENIESRLLWKPMHLQPIFQKYPYYGGKVAENLFKSGLCLPSGSNLTDDNKSRIKEVITNFFK